MIPENILALQRQDATLRSQSLELIDADSAMSDHLSAVEAAMKAIFDHVVDRPEHDGDELTLKGLGIRLFNDLAAGLGEGLAGWRRELHVRHGPLIRDSRMHLRRTCSAPNSAESIALPSRPMRDQGRT